MGEVDGGTTSVPDWGRISEEVACPLCGYQLRGLAEPRCPECGFVGTWGELLDPAKRVHPYLFEHHPERNVRAFVRTLAGGAWPWRFWAVLRPTQPSRGGRVVGYWGLAAGVFALACVAYCAAMAWAEALGGWYGYSIVAYGGTNRPAVGSWEFFGQVIGWFWADETAGGKWLALVMPVVWPWATFATLLVFRGSMRQARVRTVHVLRCVLYSFDTVAWLGLGLIVMTAWRVWRDWPAMPLGRFKPGIDLRFWDWLWAWAAVAIAVSVVRLVVAYRKYLCMRHAAAAVWSSQVILMLVAALVVLYDQPALNVVVESWMAWWR